MIAIKDFKMPENCLKCPMQFGGWCFICPDVDERVAKTVDEAWEQGKPDWCPLVEVPNEGGNCSEIPNNSDSVSRQAAIDAVKEAFNPSITNFVKASIAINKLPSAQPQRMRGRWKRAYLDHEAIGERPSILYCSNCSQCIAYPTNFCPNCGAEMKGEE